MISILIMQPPVVYNFLSNMYDYIYGTSKDLEENPALNFLKWFLSQHGFKPKAKDQVLLDMGAGTGRLLLPLTKLGYNVKGMEPYPPMIEELKQKADKIDLKVDIRKGSFQTLKDYETYDVIFAINGSLAYLTDLEETELAFATTTNALKSGGYFIVDVMNFYGLITRYREPKLNKVQTDSKIAYVTTNYDILLRESIWKHTSTIFLEQNDNFSKHVDIHQLAMISPREIMLHAKYNNLQKIYHFLSYTDRPSDRKDGTRTLMVFQKI